MKLIVGIGNPGKEYKNTRHNIGFNILDNYASFHSVEITKEKFNGLYVDFVLNGEKIILLKPLSYVNLSGIVVKKYIDYFNISVDDILIISDDLDLEFGKIRLRLSGSSGGHNGLKSIEANLGTKNYKRMKFGISNNKSIDTKNYVLGNLSSEESKKLNEILPITTDILDDFMVVSFTNLMNKYN